MFETIAKGLLITHLFVVFIALFLIGLTWYYLFKYVKGNGNENLKKFTLWSSISYLASFLLGALIYPTFRYYVRALYLDENVPIGTGLFEIKEHLSSLGIIIILASILVVYNSDYKKERKKLLFHFGLFSLLLFIMVFKTIVGFYLTGVKSI